MKKSKTTPNPGAMYALSETDKMASISYAPEKIRSVEIKMIEDNSGEQVQKYRVVYFYRDYSFFKKKYDDLTEDELKFVNTYVAKQDKKAAKDRAKSKVTERYKIGDILTLRGKIRDGSSRIVKKFEVKKVIWSIRGKEMNILILKQLSGPNNNRTLGKDDCLKYHIKYEPGLQVYSMFLGFVKSKKKIEQIAQ